MDPWSGEVIEAAQYETVEGGVGMALHLEPYGSALVMFRRGRPSRHVVESSLPVVRDGAGLVATATRSGSYPITLDDYKPWDAEIAHDAPPPIALRRWKLATELRAYDGSTSAVSLDLDSLPDWREVQRLRYCSSQGIYSAVFALDASYFASGLHVELDLGRVHDAAEVEINGTRLRALLVVPYTIDVTDYLREGQNLISVTVTPVLRNRLVGYGNCGVRECKQFKGRALSPAGLLGPVRLIPAWRIRLAA
jgi:hypothetical protein